MTTYVLLLLAVILVGIPSIFIVNKFPKIRLVFQIVFAVLIVVLSYLLFLNINKPIKFERQLKMRSEATIERLIDIRQIQGSFKDKYNHYTASFDTLIHFVQTDSFAIDNIVEVTPGTWKQDEITKEEAIKLGILQKSVAYVSVKDSLWKAKNYDITNIRYVPYTENIEFTMGAAELETASKVKVKVFECYARYIDLLNGLDKQLISNFIDEKTKYGGFEGIRVGSLTETTNNAGNWEK